MTTAGRVSPPATADVVVVGAGPAGAAAAATLARRGADVVLIDRARFPRDKTCGDGLTTGALARLEGLGIDPRRLPSFTPVTSMLVRSPRGRTTTLPLPATGGVHAASVRRIHLDAALVDTAHAAGARVLDGVAVAHVAPVASGPDAPLRVVLADGVALTTRFVVGADGAWSPVRRLVEGGRRRARTAGAVDRARGEWHGFRIYATGVRPLEPYRITVWFEPSLLPGYAWVFPLGDGTANLGVCLRRRDGVHGRELADALAKVCAHAFLPSLLGPKAVAEGPPRSWPIPDGTSAPLLHGLEGRVLFAGDAARGADPMTGEGIAQALEMGAAAGEALAAGGRPRRDGGPAASYAAALAGLVADQRRTAQASRLFTRPRLAEAVLGFTASTGPTRRLAARLIFDDTARARIADPHAWKELVLDDAGPAVGPFAACA